MVTEIIESEYTLLKFFKTFKNSCPLCKDKLISNSNSTTTGSLYKYSCDSCDFSISFQSEEGEQKFNSKPTYFNMYLKRGTKYFDESFILNSEVNSNLIEINKLKGYVSENFFVKLDNIEFWLRESAAVLNRLDRLIELQRTYQDEYSYLR